MRRALLWACRVLWATLPLTAGTGFSEVLDGASGPVRAVAGIGLWALWGAGVVAVLVPATASLTVIRLLAPLPAAAALVAVVREPTVATAAALAATLAAALVVFTAEVGESFVQASAYGEERRFLLRPPGALLLGPLAVLWLASVGALAAGALALAARSWVAGAALVAVGALATWPVVRRMHGLSRRFVVLVPAGLVVHDPLVLAETLMVPRAGVRAAAFALADTGAADLTGGALGRAVELAFADLETVVFAPAPRTSGGRAVHARAVLVSPSRPGALITAATERTRAPG